MNEYVCKLTARCPNNPDVIDEYIMTLRTKLMIQCEDIVAYTEKAAVVAMFQENLTEAISRHFRCECTLEGDHCGVAVRSTAGEIR